MKVLEFLHSNFLPKHKADNNKSVDANQSMSGALLSVIVTEI